MSFRPHFEAYQHVNVGICVLQYQRTSPIIFANPAFADLLGTHPAQLEGRSLDEITIADELHYNGMHPLLVQKNYLVRFLGGFCINCHSQAPNATEEIALKVTRIKGETVENETFLIGYVRRATALEKWLNRLKLDTDISPYCKPVLNFFIAGKWRPIATFTMPLWGLRLVHELPMLYEFLKSHV